MEYPSRYIEAAAEELARLPGVGRKTALRLTLHLLRRPQEEVNALSQALLELKANTKECKTCGNVADADECSICSSTKRSDATICVVRDLQDLMALEQTGQYKGRYHVLGGLISPMNGVGPAQLNLDRLFERAADAKVQEIILALNATMEGETTSFYIARHLPLGLRLTHIARGVPIGSELEYTDELTLARSMQHRTPYNNPMPDEG